MFIRAYLRASTEEQDAGRAKEALLKFAHDHDQKVAAFYMENVSGASLHRPELMRLIEDSSEGDIVLVEQIDRLARLKPRDWETLKRKLSAKRLSIVSPELPTSWLALNKEGEGFMDSVLQAVNAMMLDMLAAVARKDYDDRRRRQAEGISRARLDGKYKGRQPNTKRRQHIERLLSSGHSYSEIQEILGCSRYLIASVVKEQRQRSSA